MTITNTDTYLGDGLYASQEQGFILLKADRCANGVNWIGMEPEVFARFIEWAIRAGWLKEGQVDVLEPDETRR